MVADAGDVVVGIGWSSRATADDIDAAIRGALELALVDRGRVSRISTIDGRDLDLITAQGWPVTTFRAEELATVVVTDPSAAVEASVGTPSVAEAAALLAAGTGARLLLPKQRTTFVTVALATPPPG